MEFLSRLGTSWTSLGVAVLAAVGIYLAVIVLTRLAGLRSLAKMSSFDFAATVAIGSTIASVAVASAPLLSGVVALAVLYGLQYVVALLRRKGVLQGVTGNEPLLLMADGELLTDNLRQARVSEGELWSQLRQHGVLRREQVRAVVMETTGNLSVLRADAGPLGSELMTGVRDAALLARSER